MYVLTFRHLHSFLLHWLLYLPIEEMHASVEETTSTLLQPPFLMNSPAATTFLLFIPEFLLSCLNLLSHTYLPTYKWLILESGLPWGFYLLPSSSTQTAFSKVTSVLLTAGVNVLCSLLLLVASGSFNYFLLFSCLSW